MPIARWRLDTPALNGYEDIGYGTESLEGVLSCSYSDNTDSRWRGELRLGPLVTTIDCDGADAAGGGSVGTPATVNAFAFSNGINAVDQLVVGRGTKLASIKLSDRTQVMDGTMAGAGAPFAEAVTDLFYTKSANVTEEMSVGFDNTIYQVITALPATGGFTSSANNESIKNRIFGLAGSDNAAGQVAGLGRGASGMNIARQNVMTGTVTMDASSWSTRATLSGEAVIFTGFALDGRFWIIGTSNGPYYLDSDGQRFRPLIDSIDNQLSAPTNCFGLRSWDLLGPAVICPLGRSVRVIKDLQSVSVGPEVFRTNTSPVQGRLGKSDGSEMWDYWPIYNTITGETYICAVRPRQPGDPHGNLLSYYPIITLTDTESKIVAYAGTRGGQANPTVYFGSGTDVAWFLEGRTNRFPDDTNYAYAASGTFYGTELRRYPEKRKKIVRVGFETKSCTSTETVTVSIVYRDHMNAEKTVALPARSSNGWQWLNMPSGGIEARAFYPSIALARGGTTTNSPVVTGDLIVEWEFAE